MAGTATNETPVSFIIISEVAPVSGVLRDMGYGFAGRLHHRTEIDRLVASPVRGPPPSAGRKSRTRHPVEDAGDGPGGHSLEFAGPPAVGSNQGPHIAQQERVGRGYVARERGAVLAGLEVRFQYPTDVGLLVGEVDFVSGHKSAVQNVQP